MNADLTPATAACPDDATLQRMVSGILSETDERRVVRHLDACPPCQERIEQIAVGTTGIMEAARSAKVDTPPEVRSAFWPALRNVEIELQTPNPAVLSPALTVTADSPAVTDSGTTRPKAYAFLDPAEEPEYLGQIDRFKIVELVGKGGMGMVFRAFDACLQRTVAVKVLDPQYAKNEQAQGRFCREARAAAGVNHENVVTIHHVEEVEARDLSFIVMQFVKGKSVQELLDQKGPLPVREAVRIAAAVASGLAAAHATGLIHRDIKPGNILIEQTTNRVLITDFGLARLNEDVKITQTGFVAGTPLYMSPEQARGDQLNALTDLFSLGGVMYAMLTGSPPFSGSSAFVVLRQVTEARHRSVQDANPAVPAAVAEIVDRLLEKNPKNRYPAAVTLAAVLTAELARLPANDPPVLVRRSSRFIPTYARGWWRRNAPITAAVLFGLLGTAVLLEAAKFTKWTVLGQRGTHLVANVPPPAEDRTVAAKFALSGQDGAVWGVAFDATNGVLASASEGGMVKFFDTRDGKDLGALNNAKFKSPVWSVSFNKDGSKVATASDDGHVRIWDVKSKELVSELEHTFPVRCAVFSPDGKKIVSGTRDGTVTIWDAEAKEPVQLQSFKAHDGSIVMSVAFSPKGDLVATAGSDRMVRVWTVKDGKVYTNFPGHVGPVYAVAFSPDGKTLASAGWDHTVRLWDVEKAGPKASYDAIHDEDIWAVAFSRDGKHFVTAGQDRTVKWTDATTGKVEAVLGGHGGPVHCLNVSATGGLIAAGGRDGSVRVWQAE